MARNDSGRDAPTDTALSEAKRPRRRRRVALVSAALVVSAAVAVAVPLAASSFQGVSSASSGTAAGTTTASAPDLIPPQSATGHSRTGGSSGRSAASTATDATVASAAQSTGVALIDTVLGYENAAAAGTGIVISSEGLILTNNHVVEGSTQISVTIASTAQTYTATVVGTDAADDIAVLRLEGASNLQTAKIDNDANAAVDDSVTAVGNAEGGGTLLAADGEIAQLDATVTTAASGSVASEALDGMIQIVADVVSGDSGGPLLDADGEVIGMTTAASSGTSTTVAYAIPVVDALSIATQIINGDASGSVTLGYPAFLGVETSRTTAQTSTFGRPGFGSTRGQTSAGSASSPSGATIAGVIEGTPAAAAGLVAGDTITAIDGAVVSDTATLSSMLSGYGPGESVTITWVDAAGTSHSALVTLIQGPVG